jgi:hypothetical protein
MVEKKPAGPPAAQDDRRHISSDEGSYEITVEGHLDGHWSEWLGGLAISHDGPGNTRLSGIIPDQAALHGILVKIRDLGVLIVTVTRVEKE